MEKELKKIRYLLCLIALILLFGATVVRGAISVIFWVVVFLGIIGFIIWLIIISAKENEKRKIKGKEDKVQEEKERVYFEQTHPGYTRKKLLGTFIETNKVDNKPFWRIIILLTLGIPLGMLIFMIIVALVSPWIRR